MFGIGLFEVFADVWRVVVIVGGGIVVGIGCAWLMERARFYKREELPTGARAMYALIGVNALVMVFITLVLLERWGQPLSWRWAVALAIFTFKAYFFIGLRDAGFEQERRLLFAQRTT